MSEPFIVQGEPFDSQGELKFRRPEEGRPKRAGPPAAGRLESQRYMEECRGGADPAEERSPRAQPGMAVPQGGPAPRQFLEYPSRALSFQNPDQECSCFLFPTTHRVFAQRMAE